MPAAKNPRHERFAQALARGVSAADAYIEAGYKPNRGNASVLKRDQSISKRVEEIQQEQIMVHQQATAAAAARAQVTIESLIAEAEAARAKAMVEKGGAGAAVSALIAKAKLAGMWRDKADGNVEKEQVILQVRWQWPKELLDSLPNMDPGNRPLDKPPYRSIADRNGARSCSVTEEPVKAWWAERS
jgi:hypothetical protein